MMLQTKLSWSFLWPTMYVRMLFHFQDVASYWFKISTFTYLLHLMPALGVIPLVVSARSLVLKKWLPWLPFSVDSMMIVLVILTQYQRVMDRQTQVLYQYHTLHSCVMLKHAKTILFTLSLKWPIIWQVRYEACSLTCCLLCLDLRNRLLDCFVLNFRMLFLNTVLSL